MRTLLGAVLIAVAVSYLPGCTVQLDQAERYLSKEQDEEIARRCQHGCKVIPLEVWREIEKHLGEQAAPSGTST